MHSGDYTNSGIIRQAFRQSHVRRQSTTRPNRTHEPLPLPPAGEQLWSELNTVACRFDLSVRASTARSARPDAKKYPQSHLAAEGGFPSRHIGHCIREE